MMKDADLDETVSIMKPHRVGIGWIEAHFRGDWNTMFLSASDDHLVQAGTNRSVSMIL